MTYSITLVEHRGSSIFNGRVSGKEGARFFPRPFDRQVQIKSTKLTTIVLSMSHGQRGSSARAGIAAERKSKGIVGNVELINARGSPARTIPALINNV